jgi:glyoxylase-like metal-dependent hydrolase (beta-lactamase superfamily II)
VKHFQLEQVADDAWAAVALPETGAGGNAGFIRVGDFSIVFDTFASTAAADELRISAEVIAPVAYAINSHWHADHVSGNRSFDDVALVATERTRELMEERAAREIDVVFPTDVFDERVERNNAVVETLGGGHTESDAFLWFEDTVFSGDLVVVGCHPWVGDGDVEHWLEILDAFEARRPRVIVPGHGPIGSVDDIPPLRRYLEGLLDGTATPVDGWDHPEGHELNVAALRNV